MFPAARGGRLRHQTEDKAGLDKRTGESGRQVEHWAHHDLGRSARTLISKGGVSTSMPRRCSATSGAVEGVYIATTSPSPRPWRCRSSPTLIGEILDPQAARRVLPMVWRSA